ncbi:MAG: hypothetical protein U9O91_06425, partial [Candidatus Caldatribacteriota bacterium]|nr:hypothetical protein [Candidatus Caldatribacteriota bacterium]
RRKYMEKEFLENQKQLNKEGYVIVSSYFLDYGVEILGTEPAMLYIQLLNYCHKGKDLAWPTLATLGRKMQFTPKSITKFHQVLLKHGLIKKVIKGKTPSGNYNRNIYQVIPMHKVKNTLTTGKIFPKVEEKITPDIGKKLPTNNINPNNINSTAANREDAAAVADVVNFKKLREKGEEKMEAVRERMLELDFKEKFVGQLLKEYPVEKIEEKLDLLMERRNIQNPAGWLRAALKDDDWGEKPGKEDERESQPRMDSRLRGNDIEGSGNGNSQGERDKILSTKEVRERFKILRENLMAMNSP